MPIIKSWTHPTTDELTVATELLAWANSLPNDVHEKPHVAHPLADILHELIGRSHTSTAARRETPYVVTIEQTQRATTSQATDDAKQWISVRTGMGNQIHPEIAEKIVSVPKPSTCYRILTQDGDGAPQVRSVVYC